jgi:anti-anti-sigma factor
LEAGKRAGPPTQGLFGIKVEKERGSTVVRGCGELDLASAEKFDAAIQDAEEIGGPIVVDLSQVTFVDSTGLGTLLRARSRERRDGGDRLTFILSPHEPVKRLLRMTGADVLLS